MSHLSAEAAEERLFTAPDTQFTDVLRAYQHTGGPLLALAEAVMQFDSPLLMQEKYMLSSFISALVGCQTCQSVHEQAAIACGVEKDVLKALLVDIDTAPVADRLRPIFRYVKTLTLTPGMANHHERMSILNAGWPKRVIHDCSMIAGLFGMLARVVMGMGLRPLETAEEALVTSDFLVKRGFSGMMEVNGLERPFKNAPSATEQVGKRRHEQVPILAPGQRVTLVGLPKQQHNGKKAVVLEYVPHAENWRVELENAVVVRVGSENCVADLPPLAGESDDEDYPPLSEAPSAHDGDQPLDNGAPAVALTPAQRKLELAASRFVRVQERIAKEFAAVQVFESADIETTDKSETIHFHINARWDKNRKAHFAKSYTRLYKDGHRKLRVLIYDKDDQKEMMKGEAENGGDD